MNLVRLILFALLVVLVVRIAKRVLGRMQKTGASPRTEAAPAADSLTQCAVCKEYVTKAAKRCWRSNCPLTLVACVLWLALWAGPVWADDGGGRYLIEISGTNVAAKLEMNGITVDRWSFQSAASGGASLNHWLRRGGNSLRFTATALQAGQPASLQARIYFLGVSGTGVMNTVDLLRIANFAEVGQGRSVSFNVPSTPLLALWQNDVVKIDETTRQQILELIEKFRAELVSSVSAGTGLSGVTMLLAERQDISVAYGGIAHPATTGALVVPSNLDQDRLEISDLPESPQLDLTTLAGGRLIRVGRKQSIPLIGVRQGQHEIIVPALLVGKTDGAWRILRRTE